jgi:putative DNA primase/helicase
MADDPNVIRLRQMNEQVAAGEDKLALMFAADHAGDRRYVHKWGMWMRWVGTRWLEDNTLATYDLIRTLCRDTGLEVGAKFANSSMVAGVEKLARSDRRIAAAVDQWDSDTWLLNTPTCVVDLRTGATRPHRAEDYLTKCTAVGPDRDCPTPLWTAFLKRVTGGDATLVAFLWRVLGYALTGETREHALIFCHGAGSNGKSVLTSAVGGILADYHKSAPIETFIASETAQHPTDLAGLRGARFVSAVETERGRRWAESRIKLVTGGDVIAARFMRQDFFEFLPQFKLWISGNHKPRLRSVDEAFRRRFHLIPFSIVIPLAERDPELGEKLKAEWPGILWWMVRGCLAWQEHGLAAPATVRDATNRYLENEDIIATWLAEKCDRVPDAWTLTRDLFESWRQWCDTAGERPGSRKAFAEGLEEGHRLQQAKRNTGQGFLGLQLK